jgi:hypothetical protein
MDYASTVWSHRRRVKETKLLNEVQKMGAQAITGAFKTVSVAVAEAEAGITPVGERHAQAGTRLYVNMQTLPKTHPLATLRVRKTRRYLSPLKAGTRPRWGSRTDGNDPAICATAMAWAYGSGVRPRQGRNGGWGQR